MRFRPATVGEHIELTDLVFRSVHQVWNYPDDFMAWEPEAIVVTEKHIAENVTRVLEVDGKTVGFTVLSGRPPELELSRLMVEPDAVGLGYGRALWEDAVATARNLGASSFVIDSDPNAERFYNRMGAETIGEYDWEPPMMPGWHVKKMRFVLEQSLDGAIYNRTRL